jgi:hypothetical protein
MLTALIGLVAVKFKSFRQPTAELAQAGKRSFATAVARDLEVSRSPNSDLDLVAGFQSQCFDNGLWKPDSQRIAPLCDLHRQPLGYTYNMYIHQRIGGSSELPGNE